MNKNFVQKEVGRNFLYYYSLINVVWYMICFLQLRLSSSTLFRGHLWVKSIYPRWKVYVCWAKRVFHPFVPPLERVRKSHASTREREKKIKIYLWLVFAWLKRFLLLRSNFKPMKNIDERILAWAETTCDSNDIYSDKIERKWGMNGGGCEETLFLLRLFIRIQIEPFLWVIY